MRIGIDARPMQLDAYRQRGIGGYLRHWIEAAQDLPNEFAFALLVDPILPPPQVKLTAPNWSVMPLELPFRPGKAGEAPATLDPDAEFAHDSAVEAFCLDHHLDLFHATYTLMEEVFVARRLSRTRLVVTLFDLIPLVFPDEYLQRMGEAAKLCFAQRLGAAVQARRVQAISQATRQDLVRLAGLDPGKVDIVYGAVDEDFRPVGRDAVERELNRLGLSGDYIFSVSGPHHSKNLPRLLESYQLLVKSGQNDVKLVVRTPLSQQDSRKYRQWAADRALRDRIVFLDRELAPVQLAALYTGARLLACVSLYEGFGLPILEAMRCGAPVVTSNASSMAEVAGEAAQLVDPLDSRAIARGMERVLKSPALADELRAKGAARAGQFSWAKSARAVLDSYARAIQGAPGTRVFPAAVPAQRLRLAVWSPLNPRPSGVSDYAEHLIAELAELADVDVFLDGYQPSNLPLADAVPMFDWRAYRQLAERAPYDLNIYQVGNNPIHAYMYPFIRGSPGVVTFHDVFVFHFIHAALNRPGDAAKFWREVAYCEGAEVARSARLNYLQGKLDDYAMALNKRLILASRGLVVHSEWALRKVTEYTGAPPARVIPFGMPELPDDDGRFGRLMRQVIGLPTDAFIFGIFGNIHRVKRIDVALQAFARVRAAHPSACLYIMGPADTSALGAIAHLPASADARLAQGIYLHLDYASYDRMLMAMQAVDAGINLRYPTAGETSGSLSMLLGMGKPTIVSDVGSFVEYPDICCPKVPIGGDEVDILSRHMRRLIVDRSGYERAANASFQFSRDRTWRRAAEAYIEFAHQLLSAPASAGPIC